MRSLEKTRREAVSMPSMLPVLLVLLWGTSAPVFADDACAGYKWDVRKERALFAGPAAPLSAGLDPKSAPVVVPNRLYQVRLARQDRVTLARSVVKDAAAGKTPEADAYAGIANLKISTPGSYRVAIDGPFWIDVLANGTPVAAKDFQGQHGCSAPRKIVEFELAGAQRFVLQLSNADRETVLLTITASPARKF
jgi:hypothetical protein